jgi:hypothetical protein
MPKDEPMAPNPPFGAVIDYVIGGASSSPVTLDILDGSGGLIRHYSSDDPLPKLNPAKLRTAPEWFVTPVALSTRPGMHRFIWPIRLAAPKSLAGTRGVWADGVWAPPGPYRVVLTVGGRRLEQPLVVDPDPRVNLPQSAYAEQFALSRQLVETWAPLHAANENADDVIAALGARRAAADGKLAKAIDGVLARATALSDTHYSTNPGNAWWIAPQSTATLRYLDGAFDRLSNAVDDADAVPSPDVRAGYAQLKPLAESAVRAWSEFKAKDLAALNAKLKAAGQKPIE